MKSNRFVIIIAALALVAVGGALFPSSGGMSGYTHGVTALHGGQGLITL